MQNSQHNRHILIAAILCLYLIPLALLSSYSSDFLSPDTRWPIFSLGLILSLFGSLFFFLLMCKWEDALEMHHIPVLMQPSIQPQESMQIQKEILPVPEEQTASVPSEVEQALEQANSSIQEYQTKQNELLADIQRLHSEKERHQRQAELLLQEFAQYKSGSQDELEKKGSLLAEFQQTISEQRAVIEKNVQQIGSLESKVKDLSYEIKTLLHLGEMSIAPTSKPSSSSFLASKEESGGYPVLKGPDEEVPIPPGKLILSPEQASLQLKRSIDTAQKITGANHFNNPTLRFRDYSLDNYTLDLRRLFDSLRSENSCAILVYSQKENKLIFANQVVKNLLGWSPEKFMQCFPDIIQEGMNDWKTGLMQLTTTQEATMRLLMRTKSGQDLPVHCHLGIIPTGLFRSHIIAILYP